MIQKIPSYIFYAFFLLFIICCSPFISIEIKAQAVPKMLLQDENIQLEATEAVNSMYNFKFDKAEAEFQSLKSRFPTHPLPYFLMGLSQWWKIMPILDLEDKKHDGTFHAYLDTSITHAERLYDENENNYEAAFFLAAAHGFKARLFGERGHYGKATLNGKDALHYLQKFSKNTELGPEYLFGEALFNYYAVWIKENYTLLRPVLAFFPSGNKELGIKQLKEVSFNAFYTRTEAQYFLMRIYGIEEEKEELALPIARYLANTFPDNAYFQRSYARYAFTQGQWTEAEQVSSDIMYKLTIGMPGYEAISGRYASFIMGRIYRQRYRNNIKAKEYYIKTLAYAEQSDATKMNYYLYALADLAKIANEENDLVLAKQYYSKVLKNTDNKDNLHKEAKEYLHKKPAKKL